MGTNISQSKSANSQNYMCQSVNLLCKYRIRLLFQYIKNQVIYFFVKPTRCENVSTLGYKRPQFQIEIITLRETFIMNKFIIFATLVVILALLPSNLGCEKREWGNCEECENPNRRRAAPVEPELLDLIEQGFDVCNTDSEPGLTFSEINNCQVKHTDFTDF